MPGVEPKEVVAIKRSFAARGKLPAMRHSAAEAQVVHKMSLDTSDSLIGGFRLSHSPSGGTLPWSANSTFQGRLFAVPLASTTHQPFPRIHASHKSESTRLQEGNLPSGRRAESIDHAVDSSTEFKAIRGEHGRRV